MTDLALAEPPVIERNAAGASPFLLTCDHYGRAIPDALGDLGLPESELTRHIAWDIGIAGVAERMSKALGAHLIAQRYSRLVIDCNRPPDVASSIPALSEATTIPGNADITPQQADARRRAIFEPYHRRIDDVIGARIRDGRMTMLMSLHSFTPVYVGVARPWHIGMLYNRDTRLAHVLLELIRAEGEWVVGDNEPYSVSDGTDYPYRCKVRTGSFSAMSIVDKVSRGLMLADLVTLIASLDIVAPEVDR